MTSAPPYEPRRTTRRWPKWLLLGLIAVELVLVATGRLRLGTAIAVIVAIEVVITCVLIRVAWRAGRSQDGSALDRAEAAVAAIAGPVVATLMVGELRMLRSLWLGLRGRHDVPPGAVAIGYSRGRWAAPALFGFAALLELFAIDLLVPWERFGRYYGLRWVLLGLSAYGVLWVLMWVVAEKVHPHLITDRELRLRSGPMVLMRIRLDQIARATKSGLADPGPDVAVFAAPLVAPNLDLTLRTPVARLSWFGKEKGTFNRVALAVDDPAEAAQLLTRSDPSGE